MSDITSTHLEAAIIDQLVAGRFHYAPYAFVAVLTGNSDWRLGVAVANESGYNAIIGRRFADKAEADRWADGLNRHIGVHGEEWLRIIASTIDGVSCSTWPSRQPQRDNRRGAGGRHTLHRGGNAHHGLT